MNRVIAIPEVDGLPVVPGAEFVVPQADNHYIAYGKRILTPGGKHKGYHVIVAKLWRAKDGPTGTGLYSVEADHTLFQKLDPTGMSKSLEEMPKEADWPCKDEIDGSCRISSALGIADTRPVKRVKQTAEVMEP